MISNRFPPEILQSIFKDLVEYGNKTPEIQQQFYHDLYNCLFVDSYWFSNAVIILWQNTLRKFHKKKITSSKMLMNTYISSLSKETKEILYKENIINSHQKSITALCNYGALLKNLNFTELFTKLIYWMTINEEIRFDMESLEKKDHDLNDLDTIIAYHANDIIFERNRNLLYRELLKCFTTNASNLKYQLKLKNNWKDIGIMNNSHSHLKNLSRYVISSQLSLLNLEILEFHTNVPSRVYNDLSKVFSTIDKMRVKCDHEDEDENEGLMEFIAGLQKIKIMRIEFGPKFSEIITKTLNITNNYQIIIPPDVYIPLNFSKAFNKITGLEISDSGIISIDIVKSWCKFEFLPFITKLELSASAMIKVDLELYSNIIKKTNRNLIELGITLITLSDGYFYNSKDLFNTISKNCPKLKNFELKVKKRILQRIPLIFQTCVNLKKVSLDIIDDKNITKSIYYIGKVIPKNLKYFFIYQNEVNWDRKCLNTFLKLCESNSINNLLFKYKYRKPCENRNDYKKIIWKFVNRGVLNRYSNIKESC